MYNSCGERSYSSGETNYIALIKSLKEKSTAFQEQKAVPRQRRGSENSFKTNKTSSSITAKNKTIKGYCQTGRSNDIPNDGVPFRALRSAKIHERYERRI